MLASSNIGCFILLYLRFHKYFELLFLFDHVLDVIRSLLLHLLNLSLKQLLIMALELLELPVMFLLQLHLFLIPRVLVIDHLAVVFLHNCSYSVFEIGDSPS